LGGAEKGFGRCSKTTLENGWGEQSGKNIYLKYQSTSSNKSVIPTLKNSRFLRWFRGEF
jgi:hypothetical protein